MARVAILAKAYRNTGTHGAPTWVEVPEFQNVTLAGPTFNQVDDMTRESPVETKSPVSVNIDVTARLKVKAANTNYETIMDAIWAATPIDMMFLTGAEDQNGSRGVRAAYRFSMSEDQSIGNVLYEDLTGVPSDEFPPEYAKVTAGAPVFTAITLTASE
jgi:hypothetical protein